MDTPNTRARRKREQRDNEERGSGVGWQLDDELRNAFLDRVADGEWTVELAGARRICGVVMFVRLAHT
jgi:hypothetical protein